MRCNDEEKGEFTREVEESGERRAKRHSAAEVWQDGRRASGDALRAASHL